MAKIKGMNITGTWTYKEDFEFGSSVGVVKLIQSGNEVSGILEFTEKVEDDYEIEVTEKVSGIISEGKLLLNSMEVTAIQENRSVDYLPNNFEVHLVSDNKLVGSSYDSENVCGVFVMERI